MSVIFLDEYIYYLFYFFALVAVLVLAGIVIYYGVYALVCFLAWIEDEFGRFIRKQRRKRRLRERARQYKAGVKQ